MKLRFYVKEMRLSKNGTYVYFLMKTKVGKLLLYLILHPITIRRDDVKEGFKFPDVLEADIDLQTINGKPVVGKWADLNVKLHHDNYGGRSVVSWVLA